MRKIFFPLMLALMLSVLFIPTAFADNNVSGVVSLDTTNGGSSTLSAGGLQTRIENLSGINSALDVLELHIGSDISGSFNGTWNTGDIGYVNDMSNIQVLDVANTISVGNVGNNFCDHFNSMTDVIFPATDFGYNAFLSGDNLSSVNLPLAESFTDWAFSQCPNLTSVDIPSVTTFGTNSFYDCDSLTSLNLPAVTNFGSTTFRNSDMSGCDLELGATIPTVTSWGSSFAPGTLIVPDASTVSAYDANHQTWTPTGSDTDGLWEGWTLQAPGIVVNPQTGDSGWIRSFHNWIGF